MKILFSGNTAIGGGFDSPQNHLALIGRIPVKVDGNSSVTSHIYSDTSLSPNTGGHCQSTFENEMTQSHMTLIALDHTVDSIQNPNCLRFIGLDHPYTHSLILNTITTATHYASYQRPTHTGFFFVLQRTCLQQAGSVLKNSSNS